MRVSDSFRAAFDAHMRDYGTPEGARKAAQSRRGGKTSAPAGEVERSRNTIAAHQQRADRYRKAGKPEKAAEHERVVKVHRGLLKKWGEKF